MGVMRKTMGVLFAMVGPPKIADALAQPTSGILLVRNTLPFNVLGIPPSSVPCGFTRAGLPIGLQVSGPWLGEAAVLALANGYEQATDWHRRAPASSTCR